MPGCFPPVPALLIHALPVPGDVLVRHLCMPGLGALRRAADHPEAGRREGLATDHTLSRLRRGPPLALCRALGVGGIGGARPAVPVAAHRVIHLAVGLLPALLAVFLEAAPDGVGLPAALADVGAADGAGLAQPPALLALQVVPSIRLGLALRAPLALDVHPDLPPAVRAGDRPPRCRLGPLGRHLPGEAVGPLPGALRRAVPRPPGRQGLAADDAEAIHVTPPTAPRTERARRT